MRRIARTLMFLAALASFLSAASVLAAPSVVLAAPGDGWTYNTPASLVLRATATPDPDATIARVDFLVDSALLGSDARPGYRFAWNDVPAGRYVVVARAVDSLGREALSAPATLVVSADNAPPAVRLTAPANNAKYALPVDLVINAAAADVERNGEIALVEFLADGQIITTLTEKPYSATWANPPVGTHSLSVRATDNLGAQSESAPRSVEIVADNSLPKVAIGGVTNNATYLLPVELTLTASASGGEANTPVVQVEFLADELVLATLTQKPYRFVWTNPPAGAYTLTARATDNRGLAATSTARSIVVADVNAPPTVKLTAPPNNAKYAPPVDLVLTAQAADVEINDGVAQVEFLANDQVVGVATQKPYSVTWSNPAAGTYTLVARATDLHGGQSDSAPRTITVGGTNTPPKVALSAPANNSAFVAPASIALTASANGGETNTPVVLVEFLADGNVIGSVAQKPYSIVWNDVPAGSHTLTARATDSQGATTLSAVRRITVTANRPPSVTLTAPTAGQSFTLPASIALAAEATDADGSIAKVEFFADGASLGVATTTPYGLTWSGVTAGNHTLTATATDDKGGQTSTAPVAVTVESAGPTTGIYFIHPDHLGTPRLITNAQQVPVWRWDHGEPFGANAPVEDPAFAGVPFAFDLRFPGQFFDQETGTHYNYFRDYDPATGRYRQSDPIGLRGGINTYGYVSGNPISKKDPKGLLVQCRSGLNAMGGKQVGPVRHEFSCWKNNDGTYTCKGYGRDPSSSALDAILNLVPGKVLTDVENYSSDTDCDPDDNKICMDQCVADLYVGMGKNPPPYSWTWDSGTQCKAANQNIVQTCTQMCAAR